MLRAEGTGVAQTNVIFDMRGASIRNGERIDGDLEGIVEHFTDGWFGEIPQDDGVRQVHGRRIK